jgi:hypothetical protein
MTPGLPPARPPTGGVNIVQRVPSGRFLHQEFEVRRPTDSTGEASSVAPSVAPRAVSTYGRGIDMDGHIGAGGQGRAKYRYAAFVSYSHADEGLADWLHRRLEAYEVPKTLRAQTQGASRLGRFFRDRVELSASRDLGGDIREALELSDTLIVLCSPRAASSRYVNEEIRYFKELGKSDRIFAAIASGEPHAGGKPGHSADEECFPRALIFQITQNGVISDIAETAEPIAADFREGKDGREGGVLKLLAGLLGVGLDDLAQREKQAERRRRMRANAFSAAMAALALLATSAGVAAWWQTGVARENAAQALANEALAERRAEAEREAREAEAAQRERADAQTLEAQAQRDTAIGAQEAFLIEAARQGLYQGANYQALLNVARAGRVTQGVLSPELTMPLDRAVAEDRFTMALMLGRRPYAFSPRQRWLAISIPTGAVVRDAATGLFIRELHWAREPIKLVFASEDALVAVSASNSQIAYWADDDADTPTWIYTATKRPDDVVPDRARRRLALSVDGRLEIIDLASGSLVTSAEIPGCSGQSAAGGNYCGRGIVGWISNDLVLTKSSPGAAAVFDLRSNTFVWRTEWPGAFMYFAIHPRENIFGLYANVEQAPRLRIFRASEQGIEETRNLDTTLGQQTASVGDFEFAPFTSEIAVRTGDGVIIDYANNRVIRLNSPDCADDSATPEFDCVIRTLQFADLGRYAVRVLTGGRVDVFRPRDRFSLYAFNVAENREGRVLADEEAVVSINAQGVLSRHSIALQPSQQTIAGFANQTFAWMSNNEVATGQTGEGLKHRRRVDGRSTIVRRDVGASVLEGMVGLPGERAVVVASDRTARRVSFRLAHFAEDRPSTDVSSLACSICGIEPARANGDWLIIFNFATGRVVDTISGRVLFDEPENVTAIDASQRHDLIVSAHTAISPEGLDQSIRLLRAGVRSELRRAHRVSGIQISPTGASFIAMESRIRQPDAAAGAILSAVDGHEICRLPAVGDMARSAFSPDGALVAVAGAGGFVRIVRSADCSLYASIPSLGVSVSIVGFVGQGAIFTWDQRRVTRVWSIPGGRLTGHIDNASWPAVSPDNSEIAYQTEGTIYTSTPRVTGASSRVLWNWAQAASVLDDVPRITIAADRCDVLAGDVYDPRRANAGALRTSFSFDAREACEASLGSNGRQWRWRTLLARSLLRPTNDPNELRQTPSPERAQQVLAPARAADYPFAHYVDAEIALQSGATYAPQRAVASLRRADALGVPVAAYHLSLVYRDGVRDPRNPAARLFRSPLESERWMARARSLQFPLALAQAAEDAERSYSADCRRSSRSECGRRAVEVLRAWLVVIRAAERQNWGPEDALAWRARAATFARIVGSDGTRQLPQSLLRPAGSPS